MVLIKNHSIHGRFFPILYYLEKNSVLCIFSDIYFLGGTPFIARSTILSTVASLGRPTNSG